MFRDATEKEIHSVMDEAAHAAKEFGAVSLKTRKYLLHAIASGLENHTNDLVKKAMTETFLPEARLKAEISRTVLQLRQYGDATACAEWMDIRIDTPDGQRIKTDLRKTQLPIGPVVVFGSSNFPFAYSTAGGDTACALAAGCPVIIKAHPGHAHTSEMVSHIIKKALQEHELPESIFSHVHGQSFDVGQWLVMHPVTRAVAFTGSLSGGRALYDLASKRKVPIPVFAEMGSTNPVFLLPRKLADDAEVIAEELASSITTNAGQFCTKPGLIIGLAGSALERFKEKLAEEILRVAPQRMLHSGIATAYEKLRSGAMAQEGVEEVASTAVAGETHQGTPSIACVDAARFISNPVLHEEVFGPFSLIITCTTEQEMLEVAASIDGKLTATIFGHEDEVAAQGELTAILREICGRFVLNGVPTGVTVTCAMHHGGPYPATTDSRFTSVGADGIRRFSRPVSYQNWPDALLPDELKNKNPLKIWRMVNGDWTEKPING